MANRFPIILDTNDNNRLKELPNGDSIDLANGGIRNATFVETTQLILAGTTLTPFSGSYTDLTNKPNIPSDVNELTDTQNLLTGTSFANLTDKPTTLSGYGITDAFDGRYTSLTNTPNFAPVATTGNFASLTTKPTTVAGYGITDALTGASNLADLANVNNATPTDGQLLSWDNTNGYWKPITASGTGTVTSVTAGTGLTGGTITSAGTLNVDIGTGANQIVQLDADGKLPSLDGIVLYNLNITSLNNSGDVTYANPQLGQVLKYDGAKWTNANDTGGGGSITFVGDDSTGTTVDGSETFKIAGGTGITTAVSGDTLTITSSGSDLVNDTTPQLGGNLDGQAFNITTTGKILFSNVYDNLVDLPSASTYHGMFAHVHATGKAYFAHGGVWIPLANESALGDYQTTAGLNTAIDTHINTSTANTGEVLSWTGTDYDWVSNAGGGGGGSTGNFTFASSNIDTDDSSGITIIPSLTVQSDLTVQNDLVVENTITATEFISTSAGLPEIRSATNLDLHATGAVVIKNGTLRLYGATSSVRDTLSASVGDVIYNTNVNKPQVYNGSSWVNQALTTDIPTDTNQLTNGAGFATLASPTFTGTVSGISATMVGLGNVTNESKTTMFTDPSFAGTVSGVTKAMVGLSNVDNQSKATMFTDPSFTGTIAGTFGGSVQNTFTVSNNGASDYTFAQDNKWFLSNVNDPILYLRRGETYKFVISASGHPFQIRVSNGGSAYSDGITNNTIASGTLTFVVPMNAPATLYYQCTAHSGMGNTINIV